MPIHERRNKKTKNPNRAITEKSPLLPRKSDDHDGDFNGASFSGSVFNLSTSIVGAGIMALPVVMKVLGLGVGLGMIVLVAVLAEASLEILLRFSKAAEAESYGDVMGDAFGDSGKMILQGCIMVCSVGLLVVYMIIIGDVLSGTSSSGVHHIGVLEGWFGQHWWNGRAVVLLVITLAVLAPLSCFKHIDSLSFSSVLAFALAVVFLVITTGVAFIKLVSGDVTMPRWLPNITDITSVLNLFTAVPVLVTAFICHFNIHTINNELEDSSLIRPVVWTSLAICTVVFLMTSLFAFLLFGDSTLDDILANFDTDLCIPYSSVINDIVRVSYALHLILVFPIIFYPMRLNLDGLLFPSARPLVSDNWRFALMSMGLLSLVFLCANFIPTIWDVFQFIGATSAVCLAFVFPGIIVLRDPHGIATKKDKMVSVFMIGLAVFSSSIAIFSNVSVLLKETLSPYG